MSVSLSKRDTLRSWFGMVCLARRNGYAFLSTPRSSPVTKSPTVSVIMAVYNTRSEWLCGAIDSVLSQSFRDFELIIIDNGSDAATQRVLKSYCDSRIVLRRLEKNAGAAHARNEALDVARGEFLAIMDSDDISLPNRLEVEVSFLRSHTEVGVLGSCSGDADTPGKITNLKGCLNSRQIECNMVLVGNMFHASSLMFRAEVLRQARVRFSADFFPAEDFKILADLIGKTRFAKLDERLVLYRYHFPNRYWDAQEVLACQIQADLLSHLYGVSRVDALLFAHALHARPMAGNMERLCDAFRHISSQLTAHGYPQADVMASLQWAVRKTFYRTRSLRGQLCLFRSPLGREFHLGFLWRAWCLLTRGILSF